MSFVRFNEMDDMFGRMDRMMNSMMNNMFGSDPFGQSFNMISPFNHSMSPMSRLMSSSALFPTHSMSFGQHMIPESSYYSSSVMSMSTDPSGRPQIYESSHSTRSGPGGVKQTTSSVRDSRTGLQKMSIGQHIEDRAHVMERSRNEYTGEEEQNNEYINIEEEEAPEFHSEFRQKMSSYGNEHQRHRPLMQASHRSDGRPPMLALTAPPVPHSHSSHTQPQHKTHRNSKMSHKKHSSDKKTKKPYKK